ncbi:hypothetical protein PFZ49_01155 [Microbacterium lacticum]|uniref:TRAFAC clade GTPase domain-containing protein n=1 Tax=Microbacterium lacticum TaxID=33885 RepID=UPI003A8546B3
MPFFILLALALLIAYLFALGFVIVAVSTVAFVPLVLLAAVAAYLFAAVVPLVLLTSERWAQPRSANLTTPAEVVAGNVLGAAPRGEMAYHGWDHAWPNYFPYQAQRDFRFVVAVMNRVSRYFLVLPWRWVRALWNKSDGMARWLWWLPIIIGMIPTIAVPLTFFAVMLVLTSALFVGVLWVVMTVMTAIARLFGFVYGSTERSARRRASKELLCPHCYRTTLIPGYRCATCGRTHRLLSPGPLGILTRTCECGSKLPTTATRAAALGLDVVCPYCDQDLGTTAGSRPTTLIPVIGSVGVGKTTFFASAVVGMNESVGSEGTFAPTNPAAHQFYGLVESGAVLPKTAYAGRPEVMTFEASARGELHDIQLVDAAGEFFVTWETTRELTYIDSAACWVFIIDPLTLPDVRDKLDAHGVALGSTVVGTGSAGDAYSSVSDRYKQGRGELKSKSLAIVVSKADLLTQVPEWAELGTSSRAVRELLFEHGADNLLRKLELDFATLAYFAVEAQSRDRLPRHRDPVRVVDWALAQKRLRLSFLGEVPLEPQPVAAERTTTPVPTINQ